MAMKHENTTRDQSGWFTLIPPFSSLPHLPSFDFISTTLHWGLPSPVFLSVLPKLMSWTLTAYAAWETEASAFTHLLSTCCDTSLDGGFFPHACSKSCCSAPDVMACDDIHAITKVQLRQNYLHYHIWKLPSIWISYLLFACMYPAPLPFGLLGMHANNLQRPSFRGNFHIW
ncbi:hypothetical protein B0H14DRAFT_2598492 [Mycena olivaceomarginata]|nr:hypothetical protein B0H14DRAFT_2621799 [Mycena olivaceomarginata]KAJ7822569.1 hypothetical protein B0H14DRAFT_2598492 [Mycena olivaceomarginata]